MSAEREGALEYINNNFDSFLSRLGDLVRIPSVSSWKETHAHHTRKCAETVAEQLKNIGLENARLLELDDKSVPPCVFAEWNGAPGQQTVLLYAHYDVQPPGDESVWNTPIWEPTLVNCPDQGGDRLFARGAADDKAGIVVQLAAIESLLKTNGGLPVNIKILFEGEEEIGSDHLELYLAKYIDILKSDVIVLADTTNYDVGIPSLTYSLRGLCSIDVTLKTVENTLHSGIYGGLVIDPLTALCKLIGTLHDDNGVVQVEGFYDGVRKLSEKENTNIKALGYTEEKFREEASLLSGVKVIGNSETPLLEKNWLLPALNVIALDACNLDKAANKILSSATARISCRIVANQSHEAIAEAVAKHLKKHCPFGAHITVKKGEGSAPWVCHPEGKAFEAAERALKKGYGRDVVMIGCGGSIGFVEPFVQAFGGAPALLIGVEDPYTKAHGENESLCLGDFKNAMKSMVHMFFELKQ